MVSLCPICEQAPLVSIEPETWDCSRPRCNNQFFIDGEEGQRTLNVRDKPRKPILERLWLARAQQDQSDGR